MPTTYSVGITAAGCSPSAREPDEQLVALRYLMGGGAVFPNEVRPPTLPAFSEVMGASDGRFWIREYPTPVQDKAVWLAFNDRFELSRRLEVPSDFRVLDLAEDRVLILTKGEFGEEIIEVYMIEQ